MIEYEHCKLDLLDMCKQIHTNVLSLKADEALEFFMDSMHFCGFELPEYFKNLLAKLTPGITFCETRTYYNL
ncbi:hypothetical protein [Parabacteroides pacaensis]|uniref:hypothetical protein n=1 Tax=Parabacteroides pacaensis TaxID=2086575 RepID=UPI00131BA73E|nr:hypothetical protein [Parabacteroides pacaensis]